jgi:tetratricopeptide (TPR) repeat protein/tRNA A-37 threonylcarbamoyl transferase component Bud32
MQESPVCEPLTQPAPDNRARLSGSPARSVTDPNATTGGDASPSPHAAAPVPSERYALGAEIARGGMGVVYHATDTTLGREVALKVLRDKYVPACGTARRFADEARIAAQLQHPGIPPVHDLGTLPDGRPFLAMKLIKGRTLEELLAARPDVAAERGRFVAVFEQVCQAVAYAHAHGVIHRDLKPANVMVGAFGEVQVMDWGLAKVLTRKDEVGRMKDESEAAPSDSSFILPTSSFEATEAGSVLGTPAFMPPEQAVGAVGKVDRRSDVFGLGALLAVILTGEPPFAAASVETTRVLAAQGDVADCHARLAACGAEPELVALCRRCLSPRPADRPADAGEVAQAVAALRAEADERARRAELDRAAAELQAAEQRKRRWIQAALGLTFTAAVVLVCLGLWWADRRDARRRAEQALAEAAAVARARQASEAARALAADLREQFRYAAAVQALNQALALVPPDAPGAIRAQLEQARADTILVRDLDEIRFSRVRDDTRAGARRLPVAYRAAFAARGYDPSSADPAAADWVARSPVRQTLAVDLTAWAAYAEDWTVQARLLAAARRADPDPWADRLRDPRNWEAAAAGRLAAAAPLAELPPRHLVLLLQQQTRAWPGARQALASAGARHPDDFWVQFEIGYFYVFKDPNPPLAVGYLRAALALRPDCLYALDLLAGACRTTGDPDGALAAYQQALRLDPGAASAHLGLANALHDKGDLDGALAACRQALRLAPGALGHYHLGDLLRETGHFEEAERAYREAVRLDGSHHGTALDALADLQQFRWDLEGAAATYQECLRLDPAHAASRANLARVRRLQELLPRLPDVLAGKDRPQSATEACQFAHLCGRPGQERHADAVRLFEEAFAAEPRLAEDLKAYHRYEAARCAVLVACGKGADRDRVRLRGQALAWLRADLVLLRRQAGSGAAAARRDAVSILWRWRNDADLAGVRPGPEQVALPAEERAAWDALWADVKTTLAAAQQAATGTPAR